jgi:hypothetical protein
MLNSETLPMLNSEYDELKVLTEDDQREASHKSEELPFVDEEEPKVESSLSRVSFVLCISQYA